MIADGGELELFVFRLAPHPPRWGRVFEINFWFLVAPRTLPPHLSFALTRQFFDISKLFLFYNFRKGHTFRSKCINGCN